MTLFTRIRLRASTRAIRAVAAVLLLMCTVTWVAQTVSSIRDGQLVALLEQAEKLATAKAACLDQSAELEVEVECDTPALNALDETHDVKIFFLREFSHELGEAASLRPRHRDHAETQRMVSETFRPPDAVSGQVGRSTAS